MTLLSYFFVLFIHLTGGKAKQRWDSFIITLHWRLVQEICSTSHADWLHLWRYSLLMIFWFGGFHPFMLLILYIFGSKVPYSLFFSSIFLFSFTVFLFLLFHHYLLLHSLDFLTRSIKFRQSVFDLIQWIKVLLIWRVSRALTLLCFSGMFQPEWGADCPGRCGGEGCITAGPEGSSLHYAHSGWTDHGSLQPEWHRSVSNSAVPDLIDRMFLLWEIISSKTRLTVAPGFRLKEIWEWMCMSTTTVYILDRYDVRFYCTYLLMS